MRIGVVSSVPRAVAALRRAIAKNANHCVCWVASSGRQAACACRSDSPDLVLLDAALTDLSAAETTAEIVAACPATVVIVADSVGRSTSAIYAAMGRGAVDAVDMPQLEGEDLRHDQPLQEKLATLARLVGSHRAAPAPVSGRKSSPVSLVAVGSSTGGPQVLASILSALPREFPAAIVIVQHFDFYFVADLVEWLRGQTVLDVCAIEEGMQLQQGTVFVASTNDHLVVRSNRSLGYTPEPREMPYRPSVDVFFGSLHEHWPSPGVAVLLTGMGKDGAVGLKQLRLDGWHTIAQDEGSSVVYGMPKAAAACGAAIEILPSGRIASAIVAKVMR